jgi:hypothetical protein
MNYVCGKQRNNLKAAIQILILKLIARLLAAVPGICDPDFMLFIGDQHRLAGIFMFIVSQN